MANADDAHDVLSALRLGWSVAEMRGRNRPDGPPSEVISRRALTPATPN